MTEWSVETVEACLERHSFGRFPKLQTKDYQATGRFPVVDQGQTLIAGWTDNEQAVISSPLPVVVFGDHTRAFKFVDFPFVRGADGTQILRPRGDIDPRFFFYACRAIDLPGRGYNRHFTILKEKTISLPPSAEQVNIAKALRRVEDALEVQTKQLSTCGELKRATMRELFTRGLKGEAQKETEIGPIPESWEPVLVSDLGSVITGNTPPTKDKENYVGGDIQFISPADVEHGTAIKVTGKKITKTGLSKVRRLPSGTTCFVCIGSTIGKVGKTTEDPCATNQQINSIVPSAAYYSDYLFHLLTWWSNHIKSQASPSPVPILSKGAFEKIGIFTTIDQDEQARIAQTLDAIDAKIDLHKRKKAVLEDLFKSLLHKLMTGKIRVADLDLSTLEQDAAAAA